MADVLRRGNNSLGVALVKGKKQYDKREDDKKRDWEREKSRSIRQFNR